MKIRLRSLANGSYLTFHRERYYTIEARLQSTHICREREKENEVYKLITVCVCILHKLIIIDLQFALLAVHPAIYSITIFIIILALRFARSALFDIGIERERTIFKTVRKFRDP
jgi:uncharacterized membrane protein YkgB